MCDSKTDIKPVIDRQEHISEMEPVRISDSSTSRTDLVELSFEVVSAAATLRSRVPEPLVDTLADLVRAMNCYYSNLIEGHNTHPIEIERAMVDDYSDEPEKRNLQLEAHAHVNVQHWIDDGGLGALAASEQGIRDLHKRFVEQLPEELCWLENPESGERIQVIPGDYRLHEVKAGHHVPISPGAVSRFMRRFEDVFHGIKKSESVLSAAAAHHRLLWIHPFADGNGRVARLMSYAMLHTALDTGSIWSVARGLARKESQYKGLLKACDQPRQSSIDGRGNLSEKALVDFTQFFLQTCLDQINFMDDLVRPTTLRDRIAQWTEEETRHGRLPQHASNLMAAILYRGELPRSEVQNILGIGERQARRVVKSLTTAGVITSNSSRGPLRLAFPARLAGRWFPNLFPDA